MAITMCWTKISINFTSALCFGSSNLFSSSILYHQSLEGEGLKRKNTLKDYRDSVIAED